MTVRTFTTAVAYVRMSTDKQEDSPARQRMEIERLAERENFHIIRWYEDHGLTGTESKNRPQFQKLLQDTKTGEFRAVLMYEQSRFSREDVFDAMVHWRQMRDNGVKLVTCQRGELRFDDLAGLITAMVGQHEARGESIRIAQRTLSGRQQRAKSGAPLGRTPFGYQREILDESNQLVRTVSAGETFTKPHAWRSRLVPSSNPAEVDAVRQMFQAAKAGQSLRSIALELNRSGLRTSHGKPFRSEIIKSLLTNPAYAGIMRFGYKPQGKFARSQETIWVTGAHPALVSEADFEQVQAVLKAAYSSRGKSQPGRYLLSGLVHCDHCGRKMRGCIYRGEAYKDGELRQYACGCSRDGFNECPVRASVNADVLERAILSAIATHVLSDDNREQLQRAADALFSQERAPRIENQQLDDVRRRIEKGERNLALAEHAEDFAAVSAQLREWRKREAELTARLNALDAETSQTSERVELIANLSTLREHLHLADRVLLATALQETLVRVSVGRQTQTGEHVTLETVYADVTFQSGVYPGDTLRLEDRDLFSDRRDREIADYVAKAQREVTTAELADLLGVCRETARHHGHRAGLLGLIDVKRGIGPYGWRFAPKSNTPS